MHINHLTGITIFVVCVCGAVHAQERRSGTSETVSALRVLSYSDSKASYGKVDSFFLDKNGVPLLTNRPSRYRENADYIEIQISYDPVSVPTRFASLEFDGTYTRRDIEHLVHRYSNIYDISENLLFAVIRAESNYDPFAVSVAGACGLMQLMPETAREMKVTNIYDPAQNIAAGTQYLAKLREEFGNNMDLVLAAYNAGPVAVKRHQGVPPFKETRDYIRRVRKMTDLYASNKMTVNFETTTVPPFAYPARAGNR